MRNSLYFLMLSAVLGIGCSSAEEPEESPSPPEDEETQTLVEWPGAPIELWNGDDVSTLFNTTAPDTEADYYVATILRVDGKLEIMPGVTVEFSQDAGIFMAPDSELIASGTAERPILLTGREETPGYWDGVGIASNMANVMSHTTIEFAGADPISGLATYFYGGLTVGAGEDTGKLAITDCTFRDNRGYGVVAPNADLEGFARNTFERNQEAPISLSLKQATHLDSESRFLGENGEGTKDHVLVEPTTLKTSGSLSLLDVPYRLKNRVHDVASDATVQAALTIEPGVTLEIGGKIGISIENGGSLSAQGTAELPITIKDDGTSGPWAGLWFLTMSENNLLDHVHITNGGMSTPSAAWGEIEDERAAVSVGYDTPGALTMRNSSVTNSRGWGVYVESDSELEHSGNTFENNELGDLRVP